MQKEKSASKNPCAPQICMLMYRSLPQTFRRLVVANSIYEKYSDVDVFCIKEGEQSRNELVNGINCIRMPITLKTTDSGAVQLGKFSLFTAFALINLMKINLKKQYSIIHVHNPPDFILFSALPAKFICGSKIILDLHDMLPEIVASEFGLGENHIIIKFTKFMEKLAIYFSDSVICTNNYDKEIILSRNQIKPNKIFVMYNSPDEDILTVQQSNKENYGLDGKYIIIFEGWLLERRGIHIVIEAIEKIKDQIPVVFIILGDGPYLDTLMDIVQKKDLNDHILFRGWVDFKTLSEHISIADICIIPFMDTDVNRRGVPNKLFEYIVHDKAVLSSDLKGISSTFNDQEITFFEPGNANDLADKILWCYNYPELISSKITAAKNRYSREYTWEKMEEELYRCYGNLLGE